MLSRLSSLGLLGLLAVAAASAHAGARSVVDGSSETAPRSIATGSLPVEEVVVYGKRPVGPFLWEDLRSALREQTRSANERLTAEIELELRELVAPRLRLAGMDSPLVVDLPQA